MSPYGHRLLRREVIEGYRRDRVAAAVAELARETGAAGLTTTRIIGAARMSRHTFYELFESKDQSLELACAAAAEWLAAAVRASADGAAPQERLDAALGGLLEAAVENPAAAELCLIHSPSISPRGGETGGEIVVAALARALAGGREAWRGSGGGPRREPPAQLERFVAGAVVSVLATRLRQGEVGDLANLRREMAGFSAQLLETEFAAGAAARPPALSASA